MISIINQLRGVSFYLQALIPCVSILFGNKTGHGVLNHLSISSSDGPFARLLFFFNSLPSSRARSAASSGSQAQQKHIYTPLNSSPVQRMLFQRATQYRRRRKKKRNKTKQKNKSFKCYSTSEETICCGIQKVTKSAARRHDR